jgi:hypothetical protein
MNQTQKDPTRTRPTRRIRIGLTAVAMAAGTLIMTNSAGADSPAPTGVNRSGSADAAAVAVGATFYPVTPYRAYDSRSGESCTDGTGPLGPNEVRIVDVVTDEDCTTKIPSTNLVAVAYNLTVASTVGRGYLAVYPTGTTWPGNSTINWTQSRQVIANGSVVAVGQAFEENGFVIVESGPNGETDFIIDITGYYAG